MDLIRIFIDTAFARVARRYLGEDHVQPFDLPVDNQDRLVLDKSLFVDECRIHHPELTDDQIKTVYSLFTDEWAYDPGDLEQQNYSRPNIFNVIFRFSNLMLRMNNREPQVRFNHLLRWREITQKIGEDLPVAAFLAYQGRNNPPVGLNFSDPEENHDSIDFCSWPTVIHNDNPHLRHIFETYRLTELHSHLYASTDNFSLSWVSLMNQVTERKQVFMNMAATHDPSRADSLATLLHDSVLQAAGIRLNLWRFLLSRDFGYIIDGQPSTTDGIDSTALQNEINLQYVNQDQLDYIPHDMESPMGVFAGERRFLLAVCEYILQGKETNVTSLFYRYLLIKNHLRSFMVQVNDNAGFGNFKRFQDQKSVLITKKYLRFLETLPFLEANRFNYVQSMETRVRPGDKIKDYKRYRRSIENIDQTLQSPESDGTDGTPVLDWSFIFHFIKQADAPNPNDGTRRHHKLANKIRHQSINLKRLSTSGAWRDSAQKCLQRIRGIDAASAEIVCRPETFAQAFRYLKSNGFGVTFHVGEDFYDIVDGLRAIHEAILFFGLESGDRLGHALALGVSPESFYEERHNSIALPMQWMLDNVTWLYFRSRELNITLPPATEEFLLTTFEYLILRIGYTTDRRQVRMRDYYSSMMLRGDNPGIYGRKDFIDADPLNSDDQWEYYSRVENEKCSDIRRNNPIARNLLYAYQYDREIKLKGGKIKSFKLPEGYASTVRQMQEAMMRMVSKCRLAIECCPSSNVRIGYIRRFDRHPVLRFFPPEESRVKYPLDVTINTDDIGVFATSLPNEYSLLALGALKMKDPAGNPVYSSQQIYKWIENMVAHSSMYRFRNRFT